MEVLFIEKHFASMDDLILWVRETMEKMIVEKNGIPASLISLAKNGVLISGVDALLDHKDTLAVLLHRLRQKDISYVLATEAWTVLVQPGEEKNLKSIHEYKDKEETVCLHCYDSGLKKHRMVLAKIIRQGDETFLEPWKEEELQEVTGRFADRPSLDTMVNSGMIGSG